MTLDPPIYGLAYQEIENEVYLDGCLSGCAAAREAREKASGASRSPIHEATTLVVVENGRDGGGGVLGGESLLHRFVDRVSEIAAHLVAGML